MDFLTLDKFFVLDNFNIVLDKKYFVRADGRGIDVPGILDAILAFVIAIRQTLPACLDTEWPYNAAGLERLFLVNRERC